MADSSQKVDGAQVARAAQWTGLSKAISQATTFFTTIFLARILAQEDIGLFALALVCIGFIDIVADPGISSAIIQGKSASQDELSSCFWLLVMGSIAVYVGSLLAAPVALHLFFPDERLVPIVTTMAITFLLVPATAICTGTLSRELRLAAVAKIELVAALIRCGTALALAWSGLGVMSLVYGFLCERVVASILLVWAANWRPTWVMSPRLAQPLLTFGANLTAARLLWFVYSRIDIVIVGRVLGVEILGLYTLAAQIAGAFFQFISSAYYRIAFPLIARLQGSEKLGPVLLKASTYLAIVSLPVFLGISATANDIVVLFLGERWIAAVLPLQVLALVGAMQTLSGLLPQGTNAIGRPELGTYVNLFSVPVFGAAFYVGSAWYGLEGILLAWLVIFPIRYAIIVIAACRIFHLRLGEYIQSVFRPAMAAILMAVIVALCTNYMESWDSIARLAGSVLVGVFVYATMSILLYRESFIGLIRQAIPTSEKRAT